MRFLPLFFLVLISACGPRYETRYELRPPGNVEGRVCAGRCVQEHSACLMQCNIRQERCEEIAQMRARGDYLNYLAVQKRAGQPPTKTERSFYRHYPCEPEGCEERCGADQRMCHSDCGGLIIPQTVCTGNCE